MHSKLLDVGTTIFTVMSRRAAELGAVNLGQGFPDYPIDPQLADLVADAMREGHNQYAPMPGVPVLLEAIGARLQQRHGLGLEPQQALLSPQRELGLLHHSLQAPRQQRPLKSSRLL